MLPQSSVGGQALTSLRARVAPDFDGRSSFIDKAKRVKSLSCLNPECRSHGKVGSGNVVRPLCQHTWDTSPLEIKPAGLADTGRENHGLYQEKAEGPRSSSSRVGKFLREAAASFIEDLGGEDAVTTAQRALVDQWPSRC